MIHSLISNQEYVMIGAELRESQKTPPPSPGTFPLRMEKPLIVQAVLPRLKHRWVSCRLEIITLREEPCPRRS